MLSSSVTIISQLNDVKRQEIELLMRKKINLKKKEVEHLKTLCEDQELIIKSIVTQAINDALECFEKVKTSLSLENASLSIHHKTDLLKSIRMLCLIKETSPLHVEQATAILDILDPHNQVSISQFCELLLRNCADLALEWLCNPELELTILEHLRKLNGNSMLYIFRMGKAFVRQNNFSDAVKCFDFILEEMRLNQSLKREEKVNASDVLYEKACVLFIQKDYADALDVIESAGQLWKEGHNHNHLHILLQAFIYEKQKEFLKANESYLAFIERISHFLEDDTVNVLQREIVRLISQKCVDKTMAQQRISALRKHQTEIVKRFQLDQRDKWKDLLQYDFIKFDDVCQKIDKHLSLLLLNFNEIRSRMHFDALTSAVFQIQEEKLFQEELDFILSDQIRECNEKISLVMAGISHIAKGIFERTIKILVHDEPRSVFRSLWEKLGTDGSFKDHFDLDGYRGF